MAADIAAKPGYKTTEFWLSLAAMVIGAAMASGAFGDESTLGKIVGLAASVLGALGYTITRGAVKKAAASGSSS